MKLLTKLSAVYNRLQWLMWLSGVLGSVILPLVPYGLHVVQVLKEKRTISADDPELAGSLDPGSFWDFLFSPEAIGWGRYAAWVLFATCMLFLACLLALQVLAWVDARTKLSGVDKEAMEQEGADRAADREATVDDYGTDSVPAGSDDDAW